MVATAAERYDGDGVNDANGSPVINYWSFYAEPDNGDPGRAKGGKGLWGNTPSAYSDMIYGVSAAIHAANPHAVVMIGGLAYDYFTTDGGPFVQSFLNGVLSHLTTDHGGVTPTLGAVAFHYYPINTTRWPTIKDKTADIRAIMTTNGVGNLPLVVPEMGYWSSVVTGTVGLDSSEPRQAQQLVEMFARGLSVGIRQMSWFAVFDYGPGTETHGLFRGQDLNQPKPSYSAYRTLTTELFGATYASAITAAGTEGYVFNTPSGQSKTVIWATQAGPTSYTFPLTCARRVDYLGNVLNIADGTGGDMDNTPGQITLALLQDQPMYVGSC
jgi:hypothetical protein